MQVAFLVCPSQSINSGANTFKANDLLNIDSQRPECLAIVPRVRTLACQSPICTVPFVASALLFKHQYSLSFYTFKDRYRDFFTRKRSTALHGSLGLPKYQ